MVEIESIINYTDREIILLDVHHFEYSIKNVEMFENTLLKEIQFDDDELYFIEVLGWGALGAFDNEFGLESYINMMFNLKPELFNEFVEKLESKYDRMMRISSYRNRLVMSKDKESDDRKINQFRKRISLLDYCINTLTK